MPKRKKVKQRPEFNFKIHKNPHSKQPYWWTCISSNTEVRCSSENYSQKHNARHAIRAFTKVMKVEVWTIEDVTGEEKRISKRH